MILLSLLSLLLSSSSIIPSLLSHRIFSVISRKEFKLLLVGSLDRSNNSSSREGVGITGGGVACSFFAVVGCWSTNGVPFILFSVEDSDAVDGVRRLRDGCVIELELSVVVRGST